MPDPKPMSLRRFSTLWLCEAEWEPDGLQSVHIWEPLDVDAPEDAHPSCDYGREVTFYDRTGNGLIARHVRHHELSGLEDLVLLDGTWWQVQSGRPMYRNGRWWMRWWAQKNSRYAIMANAGFWAYQDPDGGIQWIKSHRALQEDVGDLLAALGLGTHARPMSPHQVVQREILPAIDSLRGQLAAFEQELRDRGVVFNTDWPPAASEAAP